MDAAKVKSARREETGAARASRADPLFSQWLT
jgi:hypothetical protein